MRNQEEACRVLILGGYGHFGGRIAHALAADPNIQLIIAGRNLAAAQAFAGKLVRVGPPAEAVAQDHSAADLDAALLRLRAAVVLHTGGPYQGQDYHVARACMLAGAHYVDLADGRGFVAGITALHEEALRRDVLLVSGASTLPGLSSAVVDAYRGRFSQLDYIESSIAPGQKTVRGVATLQAVLSYCGQRFAWLEDGRWVEVVGWQDMRRRHYPDYGTRLVAPCDVPDLTLFPARYPGLRTATFRAGLEVTLMQVGMALLAHLRRLGLAGDWARYAALFKRLSDPFDFLGTDIGGMQLIMRGTDNAGAPLELNWNLVARQGHGPQIPCIAAIVVARKLAAGTLAERGAMPCMGLMSLAEFDEAVRGLDIGWSLATR